VETRALDWCNWDEQDLVLTEGEEHIVRTSNISEVALQTHDQAHLNSGGRSGKEGGSSCRPAPGTVSYTTSSCPGARCKPQSKTGRTGSQRSNTSAAFELVLCADLLYYCLDMDSRWVALAATISRLLAPQVMVLLLP
jgi:hypothetical protein